MALSGWNKNQKLKLTIDSSKIDTDLTNFPVNITLSSGTGQTGFDVTRIFDELITISGTKNIAITDSEDNQLYVEIERWDWSAEEANLWVKVPTIISGTNTELYLYYDATVSGNTSYVGDTGDTPAQNVWDSNFKGVWHLNDVDNILDSTSNTNDGAWPIGNVALSKTCEQNSTLSSYVAANAVDGNTSTFQSNELSIGWWKVDLGAIYTISSINMIKRSGYGTRPYKYYIQTADDYAFTINVVNIITESNDSSENNTWDTNNFGTVSTRYLRVACYSDTQYINMAEFRVYVPIPADLVDGKIGKAIDFNGDDDYINCGADTSLRITSNLTIEVIAKQDILVAGKRLLGKTDNSNNDNSYGLSYWGNNIGMMVSDNGTTTYSVSGAAANTTPNYAAGVYDGSNISMYLAGVLVDGPDAAGASIHDSETVPFTLGRWTNDTGFFDGTIDEVRISNISRPVAWLKATYYSNWNDFITFSEGITFVFSSPIPTDLSTVYGVTQQLYLTTTVTGSEPNYIYDATFYNAYDDGIISSTVSGIQSGQPVGVIMDTPSGINYQWYMTATSSGFEDTSDVYTFTNKFLCEGHIEVSNIPASGIPVRLYLRDTGAYIGGTTSAGVSGTFQIETIHNDYHFVVANYFNENTNAIIADFLKP